MNRKSHSRESPTGSSKWPSSKAAGESKPEAYPQGYVEDFDEPSTKLAAVFSFLLADNVGLGEEIRDLKLRRLRRIGSMHRIEFDVRAMRLANRASFGLGRIGCTH